MSGSLVLDHFLHTATFDSSPFVSCSHTCTLTPPVNLVMERVSLIADLSVLICILVADLAAFLPLLWGSSRSLSIHWLGFQAWIFGFKSLFDLVRVILLALDISEVILLENGKSRFI